MPFLIIISRKDNEDVAVLLPHALFWFSTLLFRIENPYTQWVWIANPDQRHAAEHPLGRVEDHQCLFLVNPPGFTHNTSINGTRL